MFGDRQTERVQGGCVIARIAAGMSDKKTAGRLWQALARASHMLAASERRAPQPKNLWFSRAPYPERTTDIPNSVDPRRHGARTTASRGARIPRNGQHSHRSVVRKVAYPHAREEERTVDGLRKSVEMKVRGLLMRAVTSHGHASRTRKVVGP